MTRYRPRRLLVTLGAMFYVGCAAAPSGPTGGASKALQPIGTSSVTSLAVTGIRNPMGIGDVEKLRATAVLASGVQEDVTARAAWSSGNDAVFTVRAGGILTATGLGLTEARATFDGVTASVRGVVDQPGCTYLVSPAARTFDRAQGSARIRVTTQPGCAWTVASGTEWISVSGAEKRTGTGTFDAAVPFRDGAIDLPTRLGLVMVRWNTPTAGQNVSVTQTATCSAGLGPETASFPAAGGTGRFNIFLSNPFSRTEPWILHPTVSWITVAFPEADRWYFGGDTFDVRILISPNPDPTPRVGLIQGCNTVTITQAGS